MPLPPCRKRRHSPDGSSSAATQNDTGSSNVKVVIRVRPENEKETGSRVVTQVMNENVLVFDPKEISESGYTGGRKRPRDLRKRQNRDLKFAFDYVFGPEVQTSEVYEQTTKSILTGLLNGYNCSVFAYGATGAGKTHTMLGSKEQPGVMYLTMNDLYKRIDAMKDTKTCDVAVSYLEVYNETIRDLLMPSGCLPIREDPSNGVVVHGLSLHKPKTAEELLYMLQVGNQHRTQHPTDANAESSRSHAVFQVFIRQKDRTANLSTEVRIAKLCLVDLAGSERATVTKNRGSRFREGANINRSLLALGNVINALAENKNKGFIPYRDSKLTRLLKDSLGGNCQTVMIAAVSPSSCSFEDTYNTLRYADRAKNIKSTLKKNVLNVDFHIAKYGQIVEELRKEILELKEKIKEYEEKPPADTHVLQQSIPQDYTEFFKEINSVYRPVLTSHSEQLNSEINLRELQWKMYRKERCLSRLAALDESSNTETIDKLKGILSSLNQKSAFLTTKVEVSQDTLAEGSNNICRLKQRLCSSVGGSEGILPEPLSMCFQINTLKSDLQDSSKHIGYLKRSIRCQERELQHNERLVHRLLKIIKRQHYIIRGHNMMTSDLHNEYTAIQQIAAGQELQWEDQLENSTFRPGYRLADMLDLPSLSKKLTSPGAAGASLLSASETTVSHARDSTTQDIMQSSSQDGCSAAKSPFTVSAVGIAVPAKIEHPGNGQFSCNGQTNNTTNKQTYKSSLAQMETDSMMDLSKIKVDEIDEKSPEEDYAPKAKFLKLNDTITKCKKYVRLHTAEQEGRTSLASSNNSELNETFTLDGTFTMDPSSSCVPRFVVPCVDSLQSSKVSVCKSEVIESCPECKCRKSQVVNKTASSKNSCLNPFEIKRKTPCDTCKCAIEPHSEIESTSPSHFPDPNDDSGASTLVNSQATVSTLSDSQNLSSLSDITDVDYTKCPKTRGFRNSNKCSQSENLSDTFTKLNFSLPLTDKAGDNNAAVNTGMKVHAARSIKFDEGDNSKSSSNDVTGSDSLTIMTAAERQPVQQVDSSNVKSSFEPFIFKGTQENSASQPLRAPTLSKSNSTLSNRSSDSLTIMKAAERQPLQQVDSSNVKSSFEPFIFKGTQENSASQPLRVPALSRSNSTLSNRSNESLKRQQSFTPSYMKPTKAVARRCEIKLHPIDVPNSADPKTNMSQLKRFKSTFFNRKPRALVPSMRSKSTSNLSTRAAWQL